MKVVIGKRSKFASVEEVKELHHDEDVEDDRDVSVRKLNHSREKMLPDDEKRNLHEKLEDSLSRDVGPHCVRDHTGRSWLRGAREEGAIIRKFSGKSESSESIHDEVEPEKLNGLERREVLRVDQRAEKRDEARNGVDGQLELQELLDVVADISAPDDGLDDASKVVVEKDDVGRALGDVGSRIHGETHVGGFEGRGVVRAVSCYRNNGVGIHSVKGDQPLFVQRTCSSENSKSGKDIRDQFLIALLAEGAAFHHDRLRDGIGFGENVAVARDVGRCQQVVARDHDRANSRASASEHRLGNLLAQRLGDTDDGQERERIFGRDARGLAPVRFPLRQAEAERPPALRRVARDDVLDFSLRFACERGAAAVAWRDVRSAFLQDHLRGTNNVVRENNSTSTSCGSCCTTTNTHTTTTCCRC